MANTFESDLGKVTAYAYAVDAGYQGTEAEFEEDLLNAVSTFETDKTLSVEDKAADAKETGKIKAAMPALSHSMTTNIETGTDLDTLNAFGSYKIASATVAETLINLPDSFVNAGRLFVMTAQQSNRYIQLLIEANTVPKMYIRYHNGTRWYPWKEFVTDLCEVPLLDYSRAKLISKNTNIDNLTEYGSYYINSAAVTATLTNIPEGFSMGRIFVMRSFSAASIIQIALSRDSNSMRIWVRYYDGATWDSWTDLATGRDLDIKQDTLTFDSAPEEGSTNPVTSGGIWSSMASSLTLNSNQATAISNGTDVDTIKTPGNYKITSVAVAGTLVNLPSDFNNAGRLFVMTAQAATRYLQILIDADAVNGNKAWLRYNNGSRWTEWQRFAFVDDIKVSNGELINCGWVVGSITQGYPRESTADLSSKRILSDYIFVGQNTSINITNTDYQYSLSVYDLDKVFTGNIPSSGWASSGTVTTFPNDCFIRITVRKKDDSVITDDMIQAMVDMLEMDYYNPTFTDYQLSVEDIPSYYDSQLSTAIDSIRANMNACGKNGDTFVFITDLHWDPQVKYRNRNARRSPALVKKIIEETGLKKIILGGDYFTGNDDPDFEFNQLHDLFDAFDIKNVLNYPIMGNHDWNGYNTAVGKWNNATAYAQIMKQCENYVQMGDDLCYYFDVAACKTRYIILNSYDSNSTIPAAQITWFENVLSSTPNGYKIAVGMHVWLKIDGTQDISNQANQIIPICDNFNTSNNDREIKVLFGGHVHYDYSYTTPGGIPVILTDTDAYLSVPSGVAAGIGTINEQCFDVITLDYTNNKAKCVRIGRGQDRTFDLYS